jgi:hydrogenase large subunit
MAAGAPINMASLDYVISITQRCIEFVKNVYVPDVIAIGGFYKSWLYGGGLSNKALMAYGCIPDKANDYSPSNLLMPHGAIIDGKLSEIHPSIWPIPSRCRNSYRTAGTNMRMRARACTLGTA